MSLCPVCGGFYCDHMPEERRQSFEEMYRPATDDEMEAWQSTDDRAKVLVARFHAHDAA